MGLIDAVDAETAFVGAFVEATRRRRWVDGLRRPNKRSQTLARLRNGPPGDFDPWFVLQARSLTFEQALRWIRSRGAPEECHLMSADASLDGRSGLLADSLRNVFGVGSGTALLSLPTELVFVEAETDRFFLWKQRSPDKPGPTI